jgi:activator of HSP90 ATPase
MTYDFKLSCALPATPQAVYDAWLESAAHGAMTGGAAKRRSQDRQARRPPLQRLGGCITGKTLELIPGKRIVQSWRTSQFAAKDPDSTITIELTPTKTGMQLTLIHSGVPDGQTNYESGSSQDYYFAPMKAYFAGQKS